MARTVESKQAEWVPPVTTRPGGSKVAKREAQVSVKNLRFPWSRWVLAVWTLWRREVVRFLRQKNRIVGALGTPVVFWLLIGSGVGRSFQAPVPGGRSDYLWYFFPGILLLIILFTAIFSTISVIEDRKEGFLQGVLVSPTPRSAVVTSKLLGGSSLGLLQCWVVYALALVAGLPFSFYAFFGLSAALWILGLGLTALGFLMAWPLDSVQGYHALMNLFLMPLWLLSGALFPPQGSARWIGWIIEANPLYYGLELVRSFLWNAPLDPLRGSLFWAVLLGFAAVLSMGCTIMMDKICVRHP